MIAKAKAIELVENFEQYADYTECDVFTQRERMRINAKQCALIAVDEIIECFSLAPIGAISFFEKREEFWQEVKKEIELL